METPEAQGFARFGGLLLVISLILPWFALSFAGFAGVDFRLWTLDKSAFVLVAIYAVLALAQVSFGTRDTTAVAYLVVGVLVTLGLIYRIWISPPGSAPLGDIGGGSVTIDGKEATLGSISAGDVLEALGISLKSTFGAWVAMLGSLFFTLGAFLDFRAGSRRTAPAAAPQSSAPVQPEWIQQQPQRAEPTWSEQQAALRDAGSSPSATPGTAAPGAPDPAAPPPRPPGS